MSEELLLLVGEKIRQKRLQRNITLEQLAKKAGVTKGLISQVENNRSVPSLPVLFTLIHSLGVNVKEFFDDLHHYHANGHVVIVKSGNFIPFQKEAVKGFQYKRILTRSIMSQTADIVLLELGPGANRKQFIQTEAFECKYILKGKIEYQIENNKYQLTEGDTLFFDGRARHRLKNTGTGTAQVLVIYFF
jgi:DNA-binding XRE family transcriptional regulator/mannose-6-phosphate isomerase-like protein (cupin superfamily)